MLPDSQLWPISLQLMKYPNIISRDLHLPTDSETKRIFLSNDS
jgi:hypothetical protein